MIFDIDESCDGVWFDYGDDGGRIKLKPLTVEEERKIIKATTKKEPFIGEIREGQRQVLTHEVVDEFERFRLTNDLCIMAWEKFLDRNGTPLPCSIEMKTLLMLKDEAFREFVIEKLRFMKGIKEAEAAEASKN